MFCVTVTICVDTHTQVRTLQYASHAFHLHFSWHHVSPRHLFVNFPVLKNKCEVYCLGPKRFCEYLKPGAKSVACVEGSYVWLGRNRKWQWPWEIVLLVVQMSAIPKGNGSFGIWWSASFCLKQRESSAAKCLIFQNMFSKLIGIQSIIPDQVGSLAPLKCFSGGKTGGWSLMSLGNSKFFTKGISGMDAYVHGRMDG